MKLFLSGGGDAADSIELDKRFVAVLDKSKPLLYIPIAMGDKRHPYSECLVWVSGVFNPLGVTNIVMWTESDLKEKTTSDFEQFSGIYIGGGNTFKLLKELKEFGTFEILKEIAKKDIPMYGGSAGAIILGPTISGAIGYDKNDIGLTDFSALNMTHGYDIWCHYKDSEESKVKESMSMYKLNKVIALPETSGLIVSETSIEVVGTEHVKVFEEGLVKSVQPKDFVLK